MVVEEIYIKDWTKHTQHVAYVPLLEIIFIVREYELELVEHVLRHHLYVYVIWSIFWTGLYV